MTRYKEYKIKIGDMFEWPNGGFSCTNFGEKNSEFFIVIDIEEVSDLKNKKVIVLMIASKNKREDHCGKVHTIGYKDLLWWTKNGNSILL